MKLQTKPIVRRRARIDAPVVNTNNGGMSRGDAYEASFRLMFGDIQSACDKFWTDRGISSASWRENDFRLDTSVRIIPEDD